MRHRLLRGLAIGLAAALVLAYVGALGTGPAPFGQRLAYWAAVILPGSVLGLMVTTVVRSWHGLARAPWAEIPLVALLISIPHTFLVVVASALFFGIDAITVSLVISFWTAVMVLALVLTAINILANRAGPDVPMRQAAEPAPDLSAAEDRPCLPAIPDILADKLPPPLRAGRLRALEAEDHYLRVYTDAGSHLVLMRMGDVCALLPDAAGARVHRSWWVARAAVVERSVGAGRMELCLGDGVRVPVSRAMQSVLRRAGWGD